jgi:murein L,D-transpeptidase YcbB/YkuD
MRREPARAARAKTGRRQNNLRRNPTKGKHRMKMRDLVVAASAVLIATGAIAAGEPQAQNPDAQAIRDASVVREAQERLRSKGYAATPEGLKEFQQAEGLAPSGKLDQRTLAALGVEASAASGNSVPSGASPDGTRRPPRY